MAEFILTAGNDDFPSAGQDSSGDDTILGGDGRDTIDGGAGVNLVEGGDGNDELRSVSDGLGAALRMDSLFGGRGDDLIAIRPDIVQQPVTAAGAVLSGGGGYDTLLLYATSKRLDLSDATISGIEEIRSFGDLWLSTAQFAATAFLNMGDSALSGGITLTDGNDVAFAGEITAGYLRLHRGGQFVDLREADTRDAGDVLSIIGQDGRDNVAGSQNGHRFYGGDGRDIFSAYNGGGAGQNWFYGGNGNDRFSGADNADYAYDLDGNNWTDLFEGDDTVTFGDGNDIIFGNKGQDSLNGGAGKNSIFGGSGADTIISGGAADAIQGDGGDDVIHVGGGRDTIFGGGGRDLYVFSSLGGLGPELAGAPRLMDFRVDPATGAGFVDRIDLQGIDAIEGGDADAFNFVGTDDFTEVGQVRVRQNGLDTILELNTTGTNAADYVIRLVGTTATALESSDFLL